MLLNEIIDTQFKEIEAPSLDTKFSIAKSAVDKRIGFKPKGAYAHVTDIKHDPHQVAKIPHKPFSDLDNDAYYQYIKYIVDNKLAEGNPFLPRVYDIKVYKGTGGNLTYKIQMEKLQNVNSLSDEEWKFLCKKSFTDNDIKETKEYTEDFDNIYIGLLRDAISGTIMSKDESLENALSVIRSIQANTDFSEDLHLQNIMVRRTPNGPQIVLTDPLADGRWDDRA